MMENTTSQMDVDRLSELEMIDNRPIYASETDSLERMEIVQ